LEHESELHCLAGYSLDNTLLLAVWQGYPRGLPPLTIPVDAISPVLKGCYEVLKPGNSKGEDKKKGEEKREDEEKDEDDDDDDDDDKEKKNDDDIDKMLVWRCLLMAMLFWTAPDNSDVLLTGLWQHIIPMI
jgi:hypothetical protein